jgi:general stress protein CsbA
MWKPALIGLLGLWLIFAPFVLDSSTSNVYNNWLIGLIVTNVAIVMSSQRLWERPLATAAGVWLFICGFVPSLLSGQAVVTNDVFIAVVLIVAAIAAGIHLREELATLDRLGVLAIDRV